MSRELANRAMEMADSFAQAGIKAFASGDIRLALVFQSMAEYYQDKAESARKATNWREVITYRSYRGRNGFLPFLETIETTLQGVNGENPPGTRDS